MPAPSSDHAPDASTVRRSAEEVLRRRDEELATVRRSLDEEHRLREMLEHVELAAVTLDRDGNVTFCNDYLLRLTGLDADEVIGRNWFDRFSPPESAGQLEALYRGDLVRGRMRAHFESIVVTRHGERRLVAWNTTVLRSARGTVVGTTGLGVDVTDQRHTEEELQRHQKQLEQLVAERTAALETTHEQLRSAERLASLGTMAAGLGHDMNNVLLPLRSRLDALDALSLPERAREHFDAVRKSAEYLQQLADGLHLLALDPDDPMASTELTDLRSWWNQVGPLLSRSLPEHVRLESGWPADLPPVRVMPHRLSQAVLNLLVNAGEAIGPEVAQGRVRIWAEHDVVARVVHLGVADNGAGMSPDVKRHALDPFFTTKKRGLGTGLGLALVAGVARSTGGSLAIDSDRGRGTTIRLTLPALEPVDSTRPPDGAGVRMAAVVSIKDPRTASFIASFLKAAGVEVTYNDAGDPGTGALWVTEPSPARSKAARGYLVEPHRQVVVVGPAPRDWVQLGAIVIDDPYELEGTRAAIGRALSLARGGPV